MLNFQQPFEFRTNGDKPVLHDECASSENVKFLTFVSFAELDVVLKTSKRYYSMASLSKLTLNT